MANKRNRGRPDMYDTLYMYETLGSVWPGTVVGLPDGIGGQKSGQ